MCPKDRYCKTLQAGMLCVCLGMLSRAFSKSSLVASSSLPRGICFMGCLVFAHAKVLSSLFRFSFNFQFCASQRGYIWRFWAAFGQVLQVSAVRASSSVLAPHSRGKDTVVWRVPPWEGRCDIIFPLSSSHVATSSWQCLAEGHFQHWPLFVPWELWDLAVCILAVTYFFSPYLLAFCY